MIKLKSLLSESKRYINIFYHATDIKPEIILKNGFDVNKVGTHFSKSKNFNGVYFGISPKQVYRFGKYLYKVHIQIDEDKLYQIEEDDFNELSKQGKTTDAYVHANNYEAVVVWNVIYSGTIAGHELILYKPKKWIKKIEYVPEPT